MKYTYYLIMALLGLAFASCDKQADFITDGNFTLEFSLDTLRFDTVFTELGSATRSFKVYNRNDRPLRIDKVSLEGAGGAKFRMNVDGIAGNEVEEVEIWGKDSIYIFVEVTIDPDQPLSASPFVIEDKVIFEAGDKRQEVRLEAWGQNANYFPSRFNKGVPVVLSCNNDKIVWDDPKPYVIYGEIFIDSCALEVMAGTQIYVHGGIAQNEVFGIFNDGIIYTLNNGSIRLLGTREAPIVIQGDRLEEPFQEQPGQWQGIILGKGSKGNVMEWATVKNAVFSVYVDSLAELTASNSRFYNTNSSGIIGFHSTISLENCLVYNNLSSSVQLILGGDYTFDYCTVASYGVDASAISMSNFFCYDDFLNCQFLEENPLKARFRNCIFFGSRRDEVGLSDLYGGQQPSSFDIDFQNCIIRIDELLKQQDGLFADFLENQCATCINATRDDALFAAPNEDDYHLDTLSIAEGRALPISGIEIDLEGNMRDGAAPDIGCFEYQ
ncbi:MAG: right-handed parallel beta-helix repeat-containing protein [Lewinellaceae bacterium]|nr:right-handed parallel beta-helix repeat-containing protein [Phaeodactylibacter sp.]MCB9346222.1 right-handed parallel beta-helix repeat-containing protein [Lewinellaceae bacterium]